MAKNTLSASIKRINRESVPSSIINLIIDLLISKKLKPGDQLPTELELAQQLGVGRNSVREAINTLSYLGVVKIKRGIGTFISESMQASVVNPLVLDLIFEQKTSKEIIELRLLIETAVAEMVIQKASDEDIQRLDEVNDRLRIAARGDIPRSQNLRDLDIEFHETLLQLTNNRPLQKIGKVIYTLFLASIEKTVEQDPLRAVTNHQLIIDAVKKRDPVLLREHMKESLSLWMAYLNS